MNQTIIHIGAGEGKDVERQLADNPNRLILVEPNPYLAASLASMTRDLPTVEVYEFAVKTGETDESMATLHEYNWNKASSLCDAAELRQIFPGLKKIRSHQVKSISPAAFISQLALDGDQEVDLVIDAPGEEISIVESLCESGQMSLFSTLTMSCPVTGLYLGSGDIDSLWPRLNALGFDLIKKNESDPEWENYYLKRNRWRYELQQADEHLKQSEGQVKRLSEENEGLRHALGAFEQELSRISQESEQNRNLALQRQAKLDQTIKARDELAGLVAQLQTQFDKVKEDKNSKLQQVRDLEEKLKNAIEIQNAETKLVEELKTQVDKAKRSVTEQTKVADDRQQRIYQLENQLAELEQNQKVFLEEMSRAEGQIDLIKDVLLREPGL